MSWISFYLGPKSTPSRTTIGVNSVKKKAILKIKNNFILVAFTYLSIWFCS